MHVGPVAPVGFGCGQLEADDVLEDVGRRVDLDVHGPPQCDPDGGAVRAVGVLARHDAPSHGGRVDRPPALCWVLTSGLRPGSGVRAAAVSCQRRRPGARR